MSPGSKVTSPKSITSAPGGCLTEDPAAMMCSPSTSTSPGVTMRPVSICRRRAACRTMGAAVSAFETGAWAAKAISNGSAQPREN